jgi:hypothetical protein
MWREGSILRLIVLLQADLFFRYTRYSNANPFHYRRGIVRRITVGHPCLDIYRLLRVVKVTTTRGQP